MSSKQVKKLKVIDLFAGAGGLSSGFAQAGMHVIGALEYIPVFARTHTLNFPNSRTVAADIRSITPQSFERQTGIVPGDCDVIAGGPPCQTFSTIGTPKIRSVIKGDTISDPRNFLFKSFFQFVEYFQPKAFLMENVPALQTKYNGALFADVISTIEALGYFYQVKVLNALNYGVPQIRKRLFIVGTKVNARFEFPEATHAIGDKCSQVSLFTPEEGHSRKQKATTVFDAITDLPLIHDGCRFGELPYSKNANLTSYQMLVRNKSGCVNNNICRISNSRAKKVFKYMQQGSKYMDLPPKIRKILPFREDIFHDRLKRLDLSKPSWTMLAHIGMDGYMYIHPTEDRTLSVREAARIQSFPDSFVFTGNMREQYVQVGNSVPPLLAKSIASAIKEQL